MQPHDPKTPAHHEGIDVNGSGRQPSVEGGPPFKDRRIDEQGHTPVHPRPGTGKWILFGTVLFAAALVTGFVIVSRRQSKSAAALAGDADTALASPLAVDVVKVVQSPASRTIPLPGECRAWYETTIYARVSGYVKPSFVDIGDHVKAGQILATIETPELDQQLSSAQSKVNADNAQVKLAQANVHFAEVTLARYKDAPKGVVSDLERDEKEADYQISMARLTSAESNLSSSQSEVDRYKAMIAFQKVTAPFDGIITQRRVDIGDLVTAGSTTNTTPLFMLAQSDKIRVIVEAPQSIAPEIHDGDKAIATAEQFLDRQFIGVVGRTSRAINDTSKTLRVEVDVPNEDMSLLPGMFVRVNFDIQEAKPSLIIPASAINFRTGGPQVATVSSDGHVTFHDVKIARDLGDAIEIKSGLSVDDRVILNTSYQITNGDVVKANEMESPSAAPPVPKVQAAVVNNDPSPLQ